MSILLIILGAIGWVVNINGWFIVPTILYKGLIICGLIGFIVAILIHVVTVNKINNKFNKF